MNLFLVYNPEKAVIANWWEYFFKSCGIYVEKRKFSDTSKISKPKEIPCLTILTPQNIKKYPYVGVAGHACLIAESKARNYENIFSEQQPDSYKEILSSLFEAETESLILARLYKIYLKTNFWKAIWLYEEFAKDDIKRWDKTIASICEKVLDAIDEQKGINLDCDYVQYMQFYCRYILCCVKYREISKRSAKSEELLNDILAWTDKYDSNAGFIHLTGRICALHPVKNKHARFFYMQAEKYRNCSDYLYDIGHSIEKVFGENEKALYYYNSAYINDNDNYCALYKVAVGKELEHKWIDAFICYGMIEKQLKSIVKYNYEKKCASSIKELDYLYKAYNRLLYIYTQRLEGDEEENNYTMKIASFKQKILSGYSFKQLADKMGDPRIGVEITEELINKFQGKCYRYKL